MRLCYYCPEKALRTKDHHDNQQRIDRKEFRFWKECLGNVSVMPTMSDA